MHQSSWKVEGLKLTIGLALVLGLLYAGHVVKVGQDVTAMQTGCYGGRATQCELDRATVVKDGYKVRDLGQGRWEAYK